MRPQRSLETPCPYISFPPLLPLSLQVNMPLNIARKTPRKSTLSAAPSVQDSNAQAKSASATPHIPQPLQQIATETTTLSRKPSDGSVYSTASKVDKKRSAWHGIPKILPSLLKPSREVSIAIAPQDREPAESIKHSSDLGSKIPVRRMTASPKASLLPESRQTPPLKGRDSNER